MARETAQETTKETAKTDDITTVKRGDNNGADGSGVKIRGEVDETKVGEVKKTELEDKTVETESNKIGGDKTSTSNTVDKTDIIKVENSVIRKIDEILDKNFLNNMKNMKSKLPDWAKEKGNMAYSEVRIKNIDKTQYFAHSGIQTEIPSVKGSGISVMLEKSPFKTLDVNNKNIVNGEGAWSRSVDAEYKILSDIQKRLGNNFNATGEVKLYKRLIPCPSCEGVINQFQKMYPNIKVEIIYEK